MLLYILLGVGALAALFIGGLFLWAIFLRRVVETNQVHIVRSSGENKLYGNPKSAEVAGDKQIVANTYYEWPTWVPGLGVTVTKLPISNFHVKLTKYEAYDSARLPFIVDVIAFFRIQDADMASQRVSNFEELEESLQNVLQGAVRRVLGTNALEEIMHSRGDLGAQFTTEVEDAVSQWGVTSVKTVEFMDIRDTDGSNVIHSIMEKEKSRINKESRIKVAENGQLALAAEINAKRINDINKQDAEQQVGLRTAQQEQAVGIAREEARQNVLESQKETTTRNAAVRQIEDVRSAEIARDVAIVNAEAKKRTQVIHAAATKETQVIEAEGNKEAQVIKAAGDLEEAKRNAEGILSEGEAKAAAEKAMLMAPVATQIELAKEIGENKGYQEYLLTVEKIRVNGEVGKAQAVALEKAELKIIANGGDVQSGMSNLMDIFSSRGGTNIAGMLTALGQTDEGQALLSKVTGSSPETPSSGWSIPQKPAR